jgi:hypothetical protein
LYVDPQVTFVGADPSALVTFCIAVTGWPALAENEPGAPRRSWRPG